MEHCSNCKVAVTGNYCHQCGQRSGLGRITLKETATDLFDTFLAPQGPFLRTTRTLLLMPSLLFREFLEGRRKKYYKPVSFFLIATVAYLLIRWMLDFDPLKQQNQNNNLDEATMHNILLASRYMFAHINQLLFILVITLAIFMKLFHYKKHTLAEYLAISFYLVGVYTIITTLNMFVITYILPGVQYLALFIMMGYFVYAMISWHSGNKFWTGLKALFTWALAIMSYMMLAFGFSYLVVVFQ